MILDQFGHQTTSQRPGLERYNLTQGLTERSIFSRFLPFATEGVELPKPLDFDRLTDEFYRRNAIVYSAVRALSRSASEPEFVACKMIDGVPVPQEVRPGNLADLIANPNEEQDCYEFMEQLIIHLQVSGNAFIHKIRSRGGNVIALELIRPDIISIMPTRDPSTGRKVANYAIELNGEKRPIPREDVIQFRLPDAFDEFWGLSPLFVLAKYGDIDKQSTDFLRAYFLNRGVPSGMLVVNGRVQDEDREELKDDWRMQFQGEEGWGRIAVMDQGVDYKELSTGLKDLDLNPVFNQSETRIAMVFGVPPILLGTNAGLERSTFSNFKESRRGFWTETLVPMYTRIFRRLTKLLAQKEFGEDWVIKADVSKVAGLQDNKEELRALAIKGFDKALFTYDQAFEILDMRPHENTEIGGSYKLSTSAVIVPGDQVHQFADLVGDVVTDIVQEEIVESEEDKIKGVGDPNPAVGKPDREDPAEQDLAKAKRLEDEAKALRKKAKQTQRGLQYDESTNSFYEDHDVDPWTFDIRAELAIFDEKTGDCIEHNTFACRECQELAACAPGEPGYPECKDADTADETLQEVNEDFLRDMIQTGEQELIDQYISHFPGNFADPLTGMIDRIIAGEVSEGAGVVFLTEMIGLDLPVIMRMFDLLIALAEDGNTDDEIRTSFINAKRRMEENGDSDD